MFNQLTDPVKHEQQEIHLTELTSSTVWRDSRRTRPQRVSLWLERSEDRPKKMLQVQLRKHDCNQRCNSRPIPDTFLETNLPLISELNNSLSHDIQNGLKRTETRKSRWLVLLLEPLHHPVAAWATQVRLVLHNGVVVRTQKCSRDATLLTTPYIQIVLQCFLVTLLSYYVL